MSAAIVPVQVVWTLKGFTRKAWWQAHEAVRDSDRGVDRHMGSGMQACRKKPTPAFLKLSRTARDPAAVPVAAAAAAASGPPKESNVWLA